MVGIVAFHVLMLLIVLGIVLRAVPPQLVSSLLGYLHNTIGITTPAPEQVRMIAMIWIGSVVLIVDGCLFLLVLTTKLLNTG